MSTVTGQVFEGFFMFGELAINAARVRPQPAKRRRSNVGVALRRSALVASVTAAMLAGGLIVPALAPVAGAATPNAAPMAGARKNATRLGFTVSGTAGLSVEMWLPGTPSSPTNW